MKKETTFLLVEGKTEHFEGVGAHLQWHPPVGIPFVICMVWERAPALLGMLNHRWHLLPCKSSVGDALSS